MSAELAGVVVGALLSLMALSYLIGDNPLYRVAVHAFVGVTAGYVTVVAVVNVLYPQLFLSLFSALATQQERLPLIGLGWLLALLFAFKLFNPQSAVGRLPLAYLVGLGAAVAVGGALTGTLVPQIGATFVSLLPEPAAAGEPLEQIVTAAVFLVGTICTLLVFWYGGRSLPSGQTARPRLVAPFARVGEVFLGAALGVLFAGVVAGSVAYLAERLNVILTAVEQLLTLP